MVSNPSSPLAHSRGTGTSWGPQSKNPPNPRKPLLFGEIPSSPSSYAGSSCKASIMRHFLRKFSVEANRHTLQPLVGIPPPVISYTPRIRSSWSSGIRIPASKRFSHKWTTKICTPFALFVMPLPTTRPHIYSRISRLRLRLAPLQSRDA